MALGKVYVVNMGPSAVNAAQSLIQLTAAAAVPFEVLSCNVDETASVVSTKVRIQINRKATPNTGMTAFTPLLLNGSDAVAATTGAVWLSTQTENADGAILVPDTFNFLSGWYYLPVPEQRIVVPGGGALAVKLPAAVNGTYQASIVFRELN